MRADEYVVKQLDDANKQIEALRKMIDLKQSEVDEFKKIVSPAVEDSTVVREIDFKDFEKIKYHYYLESLYVSTLKGYISKNDFNKLLTDDEFCMGFKTKEYSFSNCMVSVNKQGYFNILTYRGIQYGVFVDYNQEINIRKFDNRFFDTFEDAKKEALIKFRKQLNEKLEEFKKSNYSEYVIWNIGDSGTKT